MTAPAVLQPQPALGGRIRSTLPAGTQVGGYTIGQPLGAGSMGKVYAAKDAEGTDVAIKFLHRHLDVGSAGRAQLEREVAALRKLKHASVARVIDAELDGTDAFIVTELVDGVNLQTEITERGPLDPIDLFELADQLASALEAVHLAGVVHRDLKPANVMVTERGPVLIDFGIAFSGPASQRGEAASAANAEPGTVELSPIIASSRRAENTATTSAGSSSPIANSRRAENIATTSAGSSSLIANSRRAENIATTSGGLSPLIANSRRAENIVAGTPGYLDPELMSAAAPTAVSDWWSWAAVLVFAATGRPPFGAASTDDILSRAADGRVDLVGVRPRSAAALAAALHPAVRTRWTPAEVIRELRRDASAFASVPMLEGSGPDAGGELPPPPPPPPQLLQAVVPDAPPTRILRQGTMPAATRAFAVAPTLHMSAQAPIAHMPAPAPNAQMPGQTPTAQLPTQAPSAPMPGQVPVQPAPSVQVGAPELQPAASEQPRRRFGRIRGVRAPQPPGLPGDPYQQGPYQPPLDPYRVPTGLGPAHPLDRRRPGLMLAMLLPFSLLAATRPLLAFLAFAVTLAGFAVVGTSIDSLELRRARAGGRRGSDGVVTAAMLPASVVRAVLHSFPQLFLGLAVGVIVAASGFWIFGAGRLIVRERPDYESQLVGGLNEPIVFALVLAVAMAIAGLVAWFGPTGWRARLGARRFANSLAVGRVGTIVVLVLCVLAAALVARELFAAPVSINWWPFLGRQP